ncbi:hypothetical protein DFJ43DRAFT_1159871 [Lentinula guzmanii]|uniref:Uncharacterized protein n=1 Tax=Lentinula guzmanii TaxID=2804957 RepID=A0AA38J890_9AGAR|nr:hypothetical protein DFJ43DRAFT_1159871 [Lentinula guzmanii]
MAHPRSKTCFAYRRRSTGISSKYQECSRPRCSNPVEVFLCTGSKYEHHRGFFYEACINKNNPADTHFVTWRTDIEPCHVADLIRIKPIHGVLPMTPTHKPRTMQSLIEQNTEQIPFQPYPPSPARVHDRSSQGHSPAKRHTTDMEKLFDFGEEIIIPEETLTEEEARHFSMNLDIAEDQEIEPGVITSMQVLHDALNQRLQSDSAFMSTAVQGAATPFPVSADSQNAPDSANIPFYPLLPQTALDGINIPSSSSAHLSSSDCSTETVQPPFNWQPGQTTRITVNNVARNTCLGIHCFGKTGLKVNDSCHFKMCKSCCLEYQSQFDTVCKEAGHRLSSKQSASLGSTPFYTHNRPLLPLHYTKHQEAQVDHHKHSKWDLDGKSTMLTVECATFPHFCLNDCSKSVRDFIGISNEKLVAVFDPEVKGWVLQEGNTKRTLLEGEVFLVRAPLCSSGDGMKEAEEVEVNRRNPRKRKFQDNDTYQFTISSAPSTPNQSTSRHTLSLSPASTQPVPNLPSIRELSASPELPYEIPLELCTPTRIPKAKKAKVMKTDEPEILDLTLPNSGHGSWPYRLYKPMHDAYTRKEEYRLMHKDVFPKSSSRTVARANAAWKAGSNEVKARYLSDPKSCWMSYEAEVKDRHNGKIPTYTEAKREMAIESGPSKANIEMGVSQGKGRAWSLKVKVKNEVQEEPVYEYVSSD